MDAIFLIRLFLLISWINLDPTPSFAQSLCSKIVLSDFGPDVNIEVYARDDAGQYYCEHTFCVLVDEARRNANIRHDEEGAALVGFLHVPYGEVTYNVGGPNGDVRARGTAYETRVVLASALKGYIASVSAGDPQAEEYRILLTGFKKFDIQDEDGNNYAMENNPTQDFIKDIENIKTTMALAFGENQEFIDSNRSQIRFRLKLGADWKTVVIDRIALNVNDYGLNVQLPRAIRRSRPNAIISTGIGGGSYQIEIRASDGGLEIQPSGQLQSANGSPVTREEQNLSLWRAVTRQR